MNDNKEPLVEMHGVTHAYQEGKLRNQVLHGIDLVIQPGSNVFLTGYSGSGKTTLVSLIGCLRSVQSGSLKLLGQELNKASEKKLRQMRRRIGYVFQHFNLLDFMNIRQNVQQSLELQPDFTRRAAKRRSEEMLDRVGLGDRFNAYPRELSGGEKQRVAIARALVHKPRLVIADEPTAALDTATGRDIIDLVQTLSREQNSAAIVVTHNMRILDGADEILHMVDGKLGTAVSEQISLAFPTLDDRLLARVADRTERRVFQPGETIIRQGDIADDFFILTKGAVDVVLEGTNGSRQPVAHLNQRGDYFGEIDLLENNARRKATVLAVGASAVEVLVISEEIFAEMIQKSRRTRALIKDEMFERTVGNRWSAPAPRELLRKP